MNPLIFDCSEHKPAMRPEPDATTGVPTSWQQVGNGRYQPLRIRGSFPGRELG